eukprot:11515267-Karenia_brevis.AAC.1
MGKVAQNFEGVSVTRVTKSENAFSKSIHQQLIDLIYALPGTSIHGSIPCTAWSSWQHLNKRKLDPNFVGKLKTQQDKSRKLLR